MNGWKTLRVTWLVLCLLGAGLAWPQPGLATGTALSSAAAGDSATARSQAAGRALAWLALQQHDDGGFGSDGLSDWTATATVAVAFLVAGEDASTLVSLAGKTPADYLASQTAFVGSGAGDVSTMILACVSLGVDPASFGGRNWSAELAATYEPDGRYADALAPAVEAQAGAMLALRAIYQPVPAAAGAWLRAAQAADGGWSGQPGGPSDTWHTGLALHALALAGEPPDSSVMKGAIAYLRQRQVDDGGFALQVGKTTTDLPATSSAVTGLIAAGERLLDASWRAGGRADDPSVFEAIARMQSSNGAFLPAATGQADIAATAAGIQGLIARALPLRHRRLAAQQAMEWLRTQQYADGSFGSGSFTSEAVYVISLAGQDAGGITWTRGITSALEALEAQVPVFVGGSGNRSAEAGKVVRAAVAAGRDPRAFGGYDLVARIQSFYDPATGRYHPTHLYRNTLALLGLAAAGAPIPLRAVDAVANEQGESGGWGWASPTTPDMDTTGQTLSALAAAGHSPYGDDLVRAGLFIAGWQFPDGSLPSRSAATAGNSDSTALATGGLLAVGRDPRDPPYRTVGAGGELVSLLDALLAFQEDSGALIALQNRLMAVFDAVPALLAEYPAYQPARWTNLPLMIR